MRVIKFWLIDLCTYAYAVLKFITCRRVYGASSCNIQCRQYQISNTVQTPVRMSSSLLSSHLEQISLCAGSIGELQFPGPRAFTNALLAPHDITALIRDTESHERALFSIAPPPVPSKTQVHEFSSAVSASVNSVQPRPAPAPGPVRPPRRHTAVVAVLGGDIYRRIRSTHQDTTYGASRDKSEVDVDLLLHGAEKLVSV